MFQLDDNFLQNIGLAGLPDAQKKPFLQHIYDELELRVGTMLSDGMTDEQLEEFEAIIDRKGEAVQAWLLKNVPKYQSDPNFISLQRSLNLTPDDINLSAEFASTKWLEINRPDYRNVVSRVLEDLKKEVIANRDVILDGGLN